MQSLCETTDCVITQQSAAMNETKRHDSMARVFSAGAKLSPPIDRPQLLADALNIAPATISNWSSRGVSAKGAAAIQASLGISASYILEGSGNETVRTYPVENVAPAPPNRGGMVPLISWVQAGEFCRAEDPFLPGQSDHWFNCPVFHSENTFALRVRGDSMTAPSGAGRTYPEGCIIFVDPQKRSPKNGDRIIACLEGSDEVTFKVYKNEDGKQWLMPLNPQHEPIREHFSVLGTILGKWEEG